LPLRKKQATVEGAIWYRTGGQACVNLIDLLLIVPGHILRCKPIQIGGRERKVVLDLVVVELSRGRQKLIEQFPQRGNVPLPLAQFVDQPTQRLLRLDLEGLAERAAGDPDAQVGIEHQ
jgi:hypothetical protein